MEKWNEISFNLSEKKNISEDKFELIVVQVLGVLGWKKYAGDLEIQPAYKTYANKSIRMDILAKYNNQDAFIIEVKKPELPITSDFSNQLKSYMRFLKLDFGLLIGEKIQIYYDGNLFNNKDFTLLEEIEYKKDNPKGLKFVQLFQKEKFDRNNIKKFAQEKLIEFKNKTKEKELKQKLIDPNQDDLIKNILKSSLLKNYPENVIDNVFKTLEVQVLDSNRSKVANEQNNNKDINKSSEKTKPSIKTGIKKKEAINILNSYLVNKNYTRIKKSDVVSSNLCGPKKDKWWIDINAKNFEKDFFILFIDSKKNYLYLFEIPKKEFYPPENFFYFREDSKRYSIKILSDDTMNFKNNEKPNKPVHLKKYLKHKIDYKKVDNNPNGLKKSYL